MKITKFSSGGDWSAWCFGPANTRAQATIWQKLVDLKTRAAQSFRDDLVIPGVYGRAKSLPHCQAKTKLGLLCRRYARVGNLCGQHAGVRKSKRRARQ